jgi:hypothetical protein
VGQERHRGGGQVSAAWSKSPDTPVTLQSAIKYIQQMANSPHMVKVKIFVPLLLPAACARSRISQRDALERLDKGFS